MATSHNIPLDEAGATVASVMLRDAAAYPADAARSEADAEFSNPRRKLILVTDGERFLGSITPERLAAAPGDAATLGEIASVDATPLVGLDDTPARALELLDERGGDRVPVVDADGALRGLVCWNSRRECFCADHPGDGSS